MSAIIVLLAVVIVVQSARIWSLIRQRTDALIERDVLCGERDSIRNEFTTALGAMRDERDAAIKAVRWMPMTRAEVSQLAKTGCGNCHGQGFNEASEVCSCAFKRMRNDARYGIGLAGAPIRLMTREECEIMDAKMMGGAAC